MKRLAAIMMTGLLAACATAEEQRATLVQETVAEGWVEVSPAELPILFADTTISGDLSSGNGTYVAYYAPDGTIRGTVKGADWSESDTGTFTINADGTMCRQWTTWSNGEQGCTRFYRQGDRVRGIVVSGNIGGNDSFEGIVTPGNTAAL